MTLPQEPSITRKIDSLLITSLAMIILGGILLILEIEFRNSVYDLWAQYFGWAGAILLLIGPLLTIFRYKWLATVSHSVTIGPVTKYLAIASYAVGDISGILLAYAGGKTFSLSSFSFSLRSVLLFKI